MDWMIMKAVEQGPAPRTLSRALGWMLALLTLALPAMAQTTGATLCGDLSNGGNGPFDFRNQRQLLAAGEHDHFTPKVESLIGGQSSSIGADLHYILVMFPNHPRGLMSLMRYGERLRTPKPRDMQYPVECYFERALRFRADDNVVRMIYAMYLSKNARQPEAVRELDRVAATAGENAFTHYNAGLLYFEMKEYDKSVARARAAQALEFPRTDLIEKLKGVGKWPQEEAALVAPAAPAAAASAASSAAPS